MKTRSGVVWLSGCFVWLVAVAAVPRIEADETKTVYSVVEGTVVDEDGQPVEGVRISAETRKEVEPTTTGADGRFWLSLPLYADKHIYATLFATSGDGRLGANRVLDNAENIEPVTITLKPARTLEVLVVDGDGQPVPDAEVHAIMDHHQAASGKTGADGRWTARVPEDMITDWRVYALRSGVGFDYARSESRIERARARAKGLPEPRKPLPETLMLSLDGARRLRIKAVDNAGKPLAGVEVGPWVLQKPGHERMANGMTRVFQKTDEAGIATFEWLPRQLGKLWIITASEDYYLPGHHERIDANQAVDEVTMKFFPLEELSGQVTTADGRPSPGATVEVKGSGTSLSGYSGETVTDADGRFRFSVHSEEVYIITATKEDQAAPYKWGVIVRVGHPVEGVEMVLGPGTFVRGRVIVPKGRRSAAGVGVEAVINKGLIPPQLRRKVRFSHSIGMSMSISTGTDANGRYELLLGPGEYRLYGPSDEEPEILTVPPADAPREIRRSFDMSRPRRKEGKLLGMVEDQPK